MSENERRKRGRPRATDTDQKIDLILSQAARLFSDKGFNKTSFDSVAKAANMTLAGLTYHFPRKIDLLLAVLERRDAQVVPRDFDATDQSRRDIFILLVTMMERDLGEGADLTRLFLILSAEATSDTHPAHAWFQKRHAFVLDQLTSTLKTMQSESRIQPDCDCAQTALSILAMMEGLQRWWLITQDVAAVLEAFESYIAGLREKLTKT